MYSRGLRRVSQGCRRSHGAHKSLLREHQLASQAGGPFGLEAENPLWAEAFRLVHLCTTGLLSSKSEDGRADPVRPIPFLRWTLLTRAGFHLLLWADLGTPNVADLFCQLRPTLSASLGSLLRLAELAIQPELRLTQLRLAHHDGGRFLPTPLMVRPAEIQPGLALVAPLSVEERCLSLLDGGGLPLMPVTALMAVVLSGIPLVDLLLVVHLRLSHHVRGGPFLPPTIPLNALAGQRT